MRLIKNILKTIPNCVLAEIQLPLVEIYSQDISKLCLSRNSIASHRKYSKTIPNCVLAEIQLPLIKFILKTIPICVLAKIQLPLIETILGQFQIVS